MKGLQDDRDVQRPLAASHHSERSQDDDVCEPVWHQHVELYLTCCVDTQICLYILLHTA